MMLSSSAIEGVLASSLCDEEGGFLRAFVDGGMDSDAIPLAEQKLKRIMFSGSGHTSGIPCPTLGSVAVQDTLMAGVTSSQFPVSVRVFGPDAAPITKAGWHTDVLARHTYAYVDLIDTVFKALAPRIVASIPDAGRVSKGLSSSVSRSLARQKDSILELRDNWDGYGATSFKLEHVDGFFQELGAILKSSSYAGPLPEIAPGGDGSLQVEIRNNKVEVYYGWEPEGRRYLHVELNGSLETFFDREAAQEFTAAVRKYFGGARDGLSSTAFR